MEYFKENRDKIIKKWDSLGFLDGLTCSVNESTQLYEQITPVEIKEPFIPPIIRRIVSQLPDNIDIVSVIKKE